MRTISSTIAKRMRALLPAALLAGAAFTASAAADPATACGAPREWDIGAYDNCWNSGIGRGFNQKEFDEHVQWCCFISGGDWNAANGECRAPPAEPAGDQQIVPTAVLPPGGVTATFTPAPPPTVRNPGNVIETFAPAPVS